MAVGLFLRSSKINAKTLEVVCPNIINIIIQYNNILLLLLLYVNAKTSVAAAARGSLKLYFTMRIEPRA